MGDWNRDSNRFDFPGRTCLSSDFESFAFSRTAWRIGHECLRRLSTTASYHMSPISQLPIIPPLVPSLSFILTMGGWINFVNKPKLSEESYLKTLPTTLITLPFLCNVFSKTETLPPQCLSVSFLAYVATKYIWTNNSVTILAEIIRTIIIIVLS